MSMQQTGEHDAHAHAQQQVAGDAPLLMFAYGSMCNPVSLNRRQLFPSASTPAVLQGYRLAFELSGGMANIVREEGGVTHGVLHTVTRAEFDVLKGIELHYATIEVRVTPYSSRSGSGAAAGGGSSAAPAETVTAAAFIVQREALDAMKAQHPEWLADPLPSDRYLRIISAGLTHYGADPAWVAALAALPCKPSRPPHEYYKAAVAVAEGGPGPQLPTFSAAQLAAAGQAFREGASTKAVFGLGPKVLQVDVPGKQDAPIAQTFMRQHFAGHDAAYAVCMMLQEPRLPPLNSPHDLRTEHVEWAEDMLVEFMQTQGMTVQQVGWVEPPAQAAATAAAAERAVQQDAEQALHDEDAVTVAPETGVLL